MAFAIRGVRIQDTRIADVPFRMRPRLVQPKEADGA